MKKLNTRNPRTQFWVQSTKPELEGKLGSTFALSNGLLGLRGAHEECPPWGRPEFYIAGTFAGGPPSLLGFHDPDHILTHPARITPEALKQVQQSAIWTLPNFPFPIAVRLKMGSVEFSHERSKVLSNERLLDMDQALLRRCLVFRDTEGRRTRVESERFVSMHDRNLICLRYRVRPLEHNGTVEVSGYLKTDVTSPGGVVLWRTGQTIEEPLRRGVECVTSESNLHVAIAQQAVLTECNGETTLDLFVIAGEMPLNEALSRAEAASKDGFVACQKKHVTAYSEVSAGGAVEFDENPATVQGFRFGQMHLHMAMGPAAERAGAPLKGLTGCGYRFVNFWDMDFHMFPFYLMTRPNDARKLLVYRYRQLDAYRQNAIKWGAKGAQVPWETNTRGVEETAPWLCLQEREIHISADAAYMFKMYDELTADHRVIVEMGAEFVIETARFYASRIRWVQERGRYELPDIGCPDQYHTFADNNVFISLMARWNLEYASELASDPEHAATVAKLGLSQAEIAEWHEKISKLYIIAPNEDGIVEEFDGFFGLEPDLEGICETYCRHSQAVKQPDVLAAMVRFESLYPLDIRRRNWLFYNDRTLHGSSLSLPGMAYAAARCGLNDAALYNLHKSARMDLDDVNMDTERGVHVSGNAVGWETVVFGFGGLTPTRDCLQFRPNLPRQWQFMRFTVHWKGQRVEVEVRKRRVSFHVGTLNATPVVVRIQDGEALTLAPGSSTKLSY